MNILVVDDEEMAHQLVTAVIRVIGDVSVVSAYSAEEALSKAHEQVPDLIISDINMPDMDGLMLVQRLRADAGLSHVPILLLTARGEAQDKYAGFLTGADDYLTKPFDVIELQLRIKALLRRSSVRAGAPAPTGPLALGRLALVPGRYAVQIDGRELRFTASEYAILRHLAEHAAHLVTAEALLQHALGYPAKVGNPQTVHSHMRNIRGKFRKGGIEPDFLTSSWQGYTLEFPAP
jgi:two-component system response regulator RpaA